MLYGNVDNDYYYMSPEALYKRGIDYEDELNGEPNYNVAARYYYLANIKSLEKNKTKHEGAVARLNSLKKKYSVIGYDVDVKEKTQYTGFASDTQTTGLLSKKLNFTNNEDPFAEIYNVSETDLPIVISGQINKMQELRKNVDDAIQKANVAKQSAEAASKWKKNEHGTWIFKWNTDNTKETINNLQTAVVDLSNAQECGAQAQKTAFQNQEKIGQILRYLFTLGVSNIAANRSVVNRLKQEIEGASSSQLNEMAKQEILAVIKQLKAQEDIMQRQDEQSKRLLEQKETIILLTKKVENYQKISREQVNEITSLKKELQNLQKLTYSKVNKSVVVGLGVISIISFILAVMTYFR